jgi:hypothetical protein
MAELEDWTCEYNGLVMGAPDSAVSIVQVDGLLTLPDIRSADLTLVQRHGLYPGDDYMNGRTITLTLEVYGSTREEFTQALNAVQAAFLPCAAEKTFRFRFPGVADDQTAFAMARPRRRSAPINLDFANMVCNVVVELFATSPYIFGDTVRTYTVTNDGVKRDFTVAGNSPALPVILLENFTDPVLTDEVTGQFFGLDYALPTCTIDSELQTAVFGTDHSPGFNVIPGSTWPEYGFGEHRLSLTSSPFSGSGPTTATISFRERWV